MTAVTLRANGVSLLCIIVAIILCVLAAFGVDSKLGIALFPLGVAFFAASFIF